MQDNSYFSNSVSFGQATCGLQVYYRIPFFNHISYSKIIILSLFVSLFSLNSCKEARDFKFAYQNSSYQEQKSKTESIIPAAERTAVYVPMLRDKRVGLVINHTSRVGDKSLLDTLLSLEVNITTIFAPEHGLKGVADAGEIIENEKLGGIMVYSLYGKNKKPKSEWLEELDILVFDIQDVGARFYTYISTLHYVMQACAETDLTLLVLDRPNPNGFYVDGPVLKENLQSFVGMHTVPVVHGMTIGEYAQMLNFEKWHNAEKACNLEIVLCQNYDHTMTYDLPVKPSPNLPNWRSVMLYPSLCFFEGTTLSIGRGTDLQFQLIGHPSLKNDFAFEFIPVSGEGSKYPKHENQTCCGAKINLSKGELVSKAELDISYLIKYYEAMKVSGSSFFNENNFFDLLAGTYDLRKQIEAGISEAEIRESWQKDLDLFKIIRKKYLLYPDFE